MNRAGSMRWARPCTITDLGARPRLVFQTQGPLGLDASEWRFQLERGRVRHPDHPVVPDPAHGGWWGRFVWRTLPAHRDRRPALREDLDRLAELALAENRAEMDQVCAT